MKASSVAAQLIPRLLNICSVNKGKAAATADRMIYPKVISLKKKHIKIDLIYIVRSES